MLAGLETQSSENVVIFVFLSAPLGILLAIMSPTYPLRTNFLARPEFSVLQTVGEFRGASLPCGIPAEAIGH